MATVSRSQRLAFWRSVFTRQAESGLSVAAFCRQEGISQGSFYQWRKKINALQDSVPPQRKQAFLPLGTIATEEPLEIEFPNRVLVRLPLSAQRETVQHVLHAVALAQTEKENSPC